VLPQREPGGNQTFDPAVAIGDVALVMSRTRWRRRCAPTPAGSKRLAKRRSAFTNPFSNSNVPPLLEAWRSRLPRASRNANVEQDVLYFVFSNSVFGPVELTLETINTKLKECTYAL
jgi:hypothetical protein